MTIVGLYVFSHRFPSTKADAIAQDLYYGEHSLLPVSTYAHRGLVTDFCLCRLGFALFLLVTDILSSLSSSYKLSFSEMTHSALNGLKEKWESVEIQIYQLKVGMTKLDNFFCSRKFAMHALPILL